MDIKNTAITAKVVIESLLVLLENENVDVSSIKFQLGGSDQDYKSPKMEFHKIIDIALSGLEELKENTNKTQVPEGFVLVPQEPTKLFKENLKSHLFDLWAGDHGCDWDGFVSVDAINHNNIWKMMIEAQERSHDS